jgi:hypothetical protein
VKHAFVSIRTDAQLANTVGGAQASAASSLGGLGALPLRRDQRRVSDSRVRELTNLNIELFGKVQTFFGSA